MQKLIEKSFPDFEHNNRLFRTGFICDEEDILWWFEKFNGEVTLRGFHDYCGEAFYSQVKSEDIIPAFHIVVLQNSILDALHEINGTRKGPFFLDQQHLANPNYSAEIICNIINGNYECDRWREKWSKGEVGEERFR